MSNRISQEYFKKVLLSSPHAILGRKGINEEYIAHLKKLLKRYKMIKVKALKSAMKYISIKDIGKMLSERTESYLIDVRGRTLVLSKEQI